MVLLDTATNFQAIASPQIIALNHAAAIIVLIYCYNVGNVNFASNVTVGPVNAVEQARVQLPGVAGAFSLWAGYRDPAANENITITWPAGTVFNVCIITLTNTTAITGLFFDAIATNFANSNQATCPTAAGTANRWIVQCTVIPQGIGGVLVDGQILLVNNFSIGLLSDYLATAAASNMTVNIAAIVSWGSICVGVMDSGEDLLWKRRRRRNMFGC